MSVAAEIRELIDPLEAFRAQAYERFQVALEALDRRKPELEENMSFYRGDQWYVATPYGVLDLDWDDDESREVLNYCRPTVRSAAADRVRARPNPEATPVHRGVRSTARSQASTELLQSFTRNGVFDFEDYYRAALACEIHGGAWLKTIWDPDAGHHVETPAIDAESGEQVFDEDGEPRMDVRREGDARIRYVSIYDALPNPDATRPDEVWYMCHRRMLPVERLEDMFPEDVHGEDTEGRFGGVESEYGTSRDQQLVEDDAEVGGYDGIHSSSGATELAELIEYWEKPSNRHPSGRMIVWCGDVIIAAGPLPYEWPWDLAVGQNKLPNSLYADGVVRDIKPLQRTLNRSASKIFEWMDKVMSPPLLDPIGSGIDPSRYSDMAGEIIPYTPGHKPEWMRVQDIPASMFTHLQTQVASIKDISTHSDISRGEAPQGLESGRALAYLNELEQGVRAPDLALWQIVITSALLKALRLVRDFYEEGRLVAVLGAGKAWMLRPFRRQDYDLDAEVVVDPFSARPHSRALRFSETLELAQAGIYEDTPQAQKIRRELELDSVDRSTVDLEQAHRMRVLSEQEALLEGRIEEIRMLEQDDHQIHIDHDEAFVVSPEFLALPPVLQDFYLEHLAQHEERRQLDLEQVAYEQALMSGSAPPPGAEGAPLAVPPGLQSPPDGGANGYPQMSEYTPPTSGHTQDIGA